MPTPQPNLASPALLNRTGAALASAIGTIRRWYEAATPAARKLLVGVKLRLHSQKRRRADPRRQQLGSRPCLIE